MKTDIKIISVHSEKKGRDYPMLQLSFGEVNPYVIKFFLTEEQKFIIENLAK